MFMRLEKTLGKNVKSEKVKKKNIYFFPSLPKMITNYVRVVCVLVPMTPKVFFYMKLFIFFLISPSRSLDTPVFFDSSIECRGKRQKRLSS